MMSHFVKYAEIIAARDRISNTAIRTPLIELSRDSLRTAGFAQLADAVPTILLKDESQQPISSFKLRGAYNMIAQLTPEQIARGVITYSSGNHAQGVAYSARALGGKAIIVMPSTTPQIKMDKTRELGAEIVIVGPASLERKQRAETLAAEHGYTVVPPYDDDSIIAGQATCGFEILEQLASAGHDLADALVLAPVSGGGLLSGVATGIKLASEVNHTIAPQVWGIEPELAADAAESFRTKALVEWPADQTTRTLADGLRTQSLGERNFAHILRFVDGFVTVSENELRTALRVLLAATGIVAEPSGAVALAGALFHAQELPAAGAVVAVVSGGNIDPALRAELDRENAAAHTHV